MPVAAIQTTYAGCHFRSRLEARWAVFFDRMGIHWQYEPQGYMVTDGHANPVPYLPDFWLPDIGIWVEVKGHMSDKDLITLCYAAFDDRGGLPISPSGQPVNDSTRNRTAILILGDVPRPNPADHILHWALRFHKGFVYPQRVWWTWNGRPRLSYEHNGMYLSQAIHSDDGINHTALGTFAAVCTESERNLRVAAGNPGNVGVNAAYKAARSARFEHGQHGL